MSNADFNSFAKILTVAKQLGQDIMFDFVDGNTLNLEGVNFSDLTEAYLGLSMMG